jgi:thioredoxin-related protein
MIKSIVILFTAFHFLFSINWENDFSKAKQTAATDHKYILLNFSGSDWCGPCIRLHKEIFETADFTAFANEHLVLVNADFPRQKKNQLSKAMQQQNDQLAEKYNTSGNFPYTLLLSPDGKIIQAWDGFPKQGAVGFINELKQAIHAGN